MSDLFKLGVEQRKINRDKFFNIKPTPKLKVINNSNLRVKNMVITPKVEVSGFLH